MKRRVLFLIITIAWMIVIFTFSAKPADESQDLSLSVGYTIGQIFVPDFEEWTIEEQEAFAERINHPVRKCAHAAEYAVLGLVLSGAVIGSRLCNDKEKIRDLIAKRELWKIHPYMRKIRFCQFLICLAIGVAYAISDEIHQLFVPGRAGKVTDVLIDSGGVIIGLLIAALIFALCRRARKRKLAGN